MFSTLTERAAAATLEALSLGATDYVTKPTRHRLAAAPAAPRAAARQGSRARCLRRSARRHPAVTSCARAVRRGAPRARLPRSSIVAIGCSTGGPNALTEMLGAFPAAAVPVVIVQHMPPVFTRLLADRLARHDKSVGE